MKLRIILSFFIGLCAYSSFAQKVIHGKVLDASTKEPLAGATIAFNGHDGTTTDQAGLFTINCGAAKRLTISFIGFETMHHVIKDCDENITIELMPASNKYEVEITASSNQNKSILYQPASITKLRDAELKRGTGLFLDDAINGNVPGVTMNRRTISAGQQFNIRGYGNGVRGTNGLNSNFDGQGYKVYLNGIPVTDAEGITMMDDIDFASIGNVEVTKGPAGSLYGLAIAGVVNLRTMKPEKNKTSIGQDVLVGSYGLQRYTTRFQTATDRSSLLVSYGHQSYDGFMQHTASKKDFVSIAGEFLPNDKQTINAYFGYTNSYDERNGELTIAQYNSFDYSGNPEYIKRNAHSEVTGFRAGLGHTYKFSKTIANTTTVFGSALPGNASSAGGWTDKAPTNFGARTSFDLKFTLAPDYALTGIVGAETQQQRAQTIGYTMAANPADPSGYYIITTTRNNQFSVSSTASYFTEWTLSMPADLSITAGLGYSRMKISLSDRFPANTTVPTQFDTAYTGMFAPHFAINKVFSKALSVYASYSRGYKAPVSSYFFIPLATAAPNGTGKVNSNLKPEVGDQFEIGTKGSLFNSTLSYELALFNAIFSDKMYAVPVPLATNPNTTAYTYISNGGKQDNKGIEALVKYTAFESATAFIKTVRPFANFTYSDFKYDGYKFRRGSTNELFDYSGLAVAGVAKYVANAGVDFDTRPGIYGNITYMYRDAMPITSDGLLRTTSYNLLNAKLGFQRSLSKHFFVDAFAGVSNITGTQYPMMVFVNQIPDAYIPAPKDANFYGGINVKYTL